MHASNAVYAAPEGRPIRKTLPACLAVTVVTLAVVSASAIACGRGPTCRSCSAPNSNAELERGRAIAGGLPERAEPYVEPRDTRRFDDEERQELSDAEQQQP